MVFEKLPAYLVQNVMRLRVSSLEFFSQQCFGGYRAFSVKPNFRPLLTNNGAIQLQQYKINSTNEVSKKTPPQNQTYLIHRRWYAFGRKSKRIKIDPIARFGGLDPATPKLGFENVKELEDANDAVKRIFSLEFADDHEIQAYRKAKLVESVQKDPSDVTSLPVKIAMQTIHIRSMAKQLLINRKEIQSKVFLLKLIDRRRRYIKNLRKTDYERFERILVEMGITYTLPPYRFRFHTKKYLEKLSVKEKAKEERSVALKAFLAERKENQLNEIAVLKKELGHDMTEEEEERLEMIQSAATTH